MKTPARALGLVLTTAFLVVVGSSTAWADAPTGGAWPVAAPRSTLDTLLLFVGGTAGLFVLIVLFALLTARHNYVPPPPSTEIEKVGDHSPTPHH